MSYGDAYVFYTTKKIQNNFRYATFGFHILPVSLSLINTQASFGNAGSN